MNQFTKLELVGPAVVCAGLLASEIASHALAHAPFLAISWYLSEDLLVVIRNKPRIS